MLPRSWKRNEFAKALGGDSIADGNACGNQVFQACYDEAAEQYRENAAVSFHRVIESCLHDKGKSGDGNLLSGGLGSRVYLRIKLSEIKDTSSEASKHYLRSALELLTSWIQQKESTSESKSKSKSNSESATDGHQNEYNHLSLLSNPFIGSRCLLASLLARLGQRHEAYAVASSVLIKIWELHEKITDKKKTCRFDCDCSILFGLTGGLQAIWFLRNELHDETLGRDLALALSYAILLEGLQEQENGDKEGTLRLQWNWNGWPYLGAGTGSVGILYALLGHTDDEWEDLGDCLPNAKSFVMQAIDDLARHRYEAPYSFSGRGNLKDALVGFEANDDSLSPCNWTHGAPGYCLLLLKAFEIYGNERFVFHARDLAETVIWARWQEQQQQQQQQQQQHLKRTRGGLGLAKGVSGIAYVFLAMARVDWRDRNLWIARARDVTMTALVACEETNGINSSTKSLFDGMGGLASLLIDLEEALELMNTKDSTSQNHSLQKCYFPFFESCQANLRPRKLEYKTRPEDHVFARRLKVPMSHSMTNHYANSKLATKSPALTKASRSTAPTEALTTSVTPQNTQTISSMFRNSTGRLATPSSSPLDVSQLTEPSMLRVTPRRLFHSSASSTPLRIAKTLEAAAPSITCDRHQELFVAQGSPEAKLCRPTTKISSFSCSDRATEAYKARAKASMLCRINSERRRTRKQQTVQSDNVNNSENDDENDNNSAFMTDSIKRIQRAEASWIQHFGGRREKEQRRLDCRSHRGSVGASPNVASRSFRRSVGAFSGSSDRRENLPA